MGHWLDQGSAKHSSPLVLLSQLLQKLYPNHSLVVTQDYRLNILSFPDVHAQPISPSELVTNTFFASLPKSAGPVPGVVIDSVEYGAFKAFWLGTEFILYIVRYDHGALHPSRGPFDIFKELLLAAGLWADQLHNEIWVYNQGWDKNAGLWKEIQKASWDEVILEDDFKRAIQKDVHGFFSSKNTYKALTLPWKRGLILHGPPGNGKTISIKIIMKECLERGYSPMYVKSLKHYFGDEYAIAEVFRKARQNSPCIVILEDLDSLINNQNRSFFLNELDGLESNDGLLLVGSTNHLERLDPGLSTRPSRFDRKYLFDDPNKAARVLYAQYWQRKLKDNKDVIFPDSLVTEIAEETERFSFAYLKEAFVSALVTLLSENEDGNAVTFEIIIKMQIKTLRKQLDEERRDFGLAIEALSQRSRSAENPPAPVFPKPDQDIRGLMDSLQTDRGGSWF
ncbi:P-loop containing nucleoside triphosphate hydrolase protein [Multifurca ochricompacta]|uniref:P-loop containing nucleoside triphosphate hydrolase protein n=1 Tax=Multifurca ochricompacta TaxID=376703 RepID=A0AAD4QQY7_9AGAM|nr:P-loop containing nucleoside triphosphate hydrolase protein [Multifurca ochricompacta]